MMKKTFKIILTFICLTNIFGCRNENREIDICRCLYEGGETEYIKKYKIPCRDLISKNLGVGNWEEINMSQNPIISAKFDSLYESCK